MKPIRTLPFLLVVLTACPARTGKHEGQGDSTVHDRLSVPAATARVVDGAEQLMSGERADGAPGDVRMENADIAVIIGAVTRTGHGHAQSGGNVLDMGLRADGHDEIEQIFTYFDDTFPRQAVYSELSVVEAGGPGKSAVVEVRGVDSELPTLAVTTRYILAPEGRALRIVTTLKNAGPALTQFEVGDAYQWGGTRHFVPGPGYDLNRKRRPSLWLAGVGDRVSYAAVPVGAPHFVTLHGGGWSDTIHTALDLPSGGSGSYARDVVVGRSFAEVVQDAQLLRGDATHVLSGTVREAGGDAVGGAVVRLELASVEGGERPAGRTFDEGGHWLDVGADASGRFEATVPPGRWMASVVSGARKGAPVEVDLSAGDGEVAVVVSGQGSLDVRVTAAGLPSPHRLRIQGRRGTPSPRFGGSDTAWGKDRIASHLGSYTVPVPPGTYRITASRGPEWELASVEVEVTGESPAVVALDLKRAFQTQGWVAGDFHQHAAPSSDSPTTLRDRVSSNLSEGVEILGSSDHNHVTDYARVIDDMGVTGELSHVVGCEVTTRKLGHFNMYPVTADPNAPNGGAFSPHGLPPSELFARMRAHRGLGTPKSPGYVAPLIQVNHPRAGKIGYFDLMQVRPGAAAADDERMDWGFDAIEVLNGKHTGPAETTLEDWFGLLNRGALVTAMGNSDTHTIHTGEAGLARTWLWAPDHPTASQVAGAIRGRRAIVSNGPFVTATLGGQAIGSIVAPTGGPRLPLSVEVQAASWVDVDTVEVIRNGEVVHTWTVAATENPMRLSATWQAPGDKPAWYVIRVRGDAKMKPVYDSTPLAFTNPIWVGTVSE